MHTIRHRVFVLPRVRGAWRLTLAIFCIVQTLVLGWPRLGHASWDKITAEDFKYLPEYCKLAVKWTREGESARPAIGPLLDFSKRVGCGSFHHYCAGLRLLQKAELLRPSSPRNHLLESAIGEFGYTLKRCQKNAPMKPEILTNLGRAYIGLKQYDSAVKVLTEAIRSNPKYEAAYAELSGIFILLNSPDDASKVLQDGLKAIPSSRLLQVRLKRLQGPKDKADTESPGQTGDKGEAGAKTPAGDKQTQRP